MKLPDQKELRRLTNEAKASAKALEPAVEQAKSEMDTADAVFVAARSRYHDARGRLTRATLEEKALGALARVLCWPEERVCDLLVTYSSREAPFWAVKARAAVKPYIGAPEWLPAFVAARQWLLRWQQENP